MKLSVPINRAYYFEITPRSVRLIYFVPRKELSALVRQRVLREEALQDFPYGLEVEVSDSEFRLVHEEYGFVTPLPPRLVWFAFRGFWIHSNKRDPARSGVLDARRLEAYARELQPEIDEFEREARRLGVSETREIETSTDRQAEQPPVWSELRDAVLRCIRPRDANPQLPLDQQEWSKVRMSRGRSAAEVFSIIEIPHRRVQHGSSG
jgi:hypothetical protein